MFRLPCLPPLPLPSPSPLYLQGVVLSGAVVDRGDGTYTVGYTVTVAGTYALSVTMWQVWRAFCLPAPLRLLLIWEFLFFFSSSLSCCYFSFRWNSLSRVQSSFEPFGWNVWFGCLAGGCHGACRVSEQLDLHCDSRCQPLRETSDFFLFSSFGVTHILFWFFFPFFLGDSQRWPQRQPRPCLVSTHCCHHRYLT